MPLYAINKQVFDVSCNDENVANVIQKEIENYTAFQINKIIESVLDKVIAADAMLKIEKLEIDLGDIILSDFGTEDMLAKFEDVFGATIIEIENTNKQKTLDVVASASQINADSEWELVASFLRNGDIPWWLNKQDNVDIDAVIQKLVEQQPDSVISFFKDHEQQTEVLWRLSDRLKPVTKRMISSLLPNVPPLLAKRNVFQFNGNNLQEQIFFSEPLPEKFVQFLKSTRLDPVDERRKKLLSSLYKIVRLLQHKYLLPVGKLFNLVFFKNELMRQDGDKLGKNIKEQLDRFIKGLSVYQVEVLLFQSLSILGSHSGKKFSSADIPYSSDTDFSATLTKSLSSENADVNSNIFLKPQLANSTDPINKYGITYRAEEPTHHNIESPVTEPGRPSFSIKEKGTTTGEKDHQEASHHQIKNPDTSLKSPSFPGEISGVESNSPDEMHKAPGKAYGKEDLLSPGVIMDNQPMGNPATEVIINDATVKSDKLQGYDVAEKTINDPALMEPGFNDEILKEAVSGQNDALEQPSTMNHKKHDSFLYFLKALAYLNLVQSGHAGSSKAENYPEKSRLIPARGPAMLGSEIEGAESGVKNLIKNVPDEGPHGGTELSIGDADSDFVLTKDKSPGLLRTEDAGPGLPHPSREGIGEQHPFENKKTQDSKDRKIRYIMKKLFTTDLMLHNYFNNYDEPELRNLEKILKQHESDDIKRKSTIRDITNQPNFFKYEVLKIFANIYFKDAHNLAPGEEAVSIKKAKKRNDFIIQIAKKIEISRDALFYLIDRLPLKEIIILGDVFHKRKYDNEDEKRIVRKILNKLPGEAVLLVKFLTELPEKEIISLISLRKAAPGSAIGPTSISGEQQVQDKSPGKLVQEPAAAESNINYSEIKNKVVNTFYEPDSTGKIYIENAGLCIVALYLRGLFSNLGYLEKGVFKSMAVAVRAVYITQYLVTGKNKHPEYLLQFNKILCGFSVDNYINSGIRLTRKERKEADELLQSVIDNWKALKNTSADGFRESFIERKGILIETDLYWTLQVERKGFDMLLNTIPWGFSIIKFPWMKKHVRVEW